ncbi:Zona pellucida-like domain family protein [Acanthocheilonema viteae]
MPNSGRTLVENITEPKNNSGNGTLYSRPMPPVNFIRIGDREILDEQWSQSKASPVHPMPRISVGERIDRLQETQPSDSSEAEAMFVAREAIVKSASSYRSAEVPQETQFRKPFQVEFNSNDKIILPDLTIREDKITPPGIFFIPEHDSVTSEPDYIESMDSSFLNTDTLFTASEQEKSEALKSEFRTSINTQLPENIQFTRSQELSSDPIGFKVMNDEPSLIQTTSEINVNELIDCDIIAFDEDKCPIENDKSDQTQSDVLFLIGVSHNISEIHFQQSLKLIMDTVEQFKNIGSNGIQISLVQFAREAVLEFSFHKHNCKPCLLADIADTKCISGLNTTDNAINKIIKYGFSKRRGDRDEAANILVVVSNGLLDGQFHEALQLLHPNNITMMIVSTTDNTNHQLTKQFVNDDKYHNLFFDATTVDSDQLSDHLAGLIRTISKEKSTSFKKIIAMETDERVQEFTVQCLDDGFNATFKFLKSFGGIITVRSKNATKNCSKVIQAEQFGEDIEIREVHFFINFKQCGVEETISVNASETNYLALVNVIHDKWLVSGADEGFVVQCYQPQQSQSQEENLHTDLTLQGDSKIAKIFPLNSIPPLCNYSIRAGTSNGPVIQSAKLGDTVYHKWECEHNHRTSDLYGLHIHDCYVESEIKQKHIIIDRNGCSADPNIVNDVIYSDDKLIAFAHVKVFKLINSEHLSFHCKLSLCIKKADGCEGITPFRCPRTGHNDLFVYHRNSHNTESILTALTVQEEVKFTVILPVNANDSAFSLQNIKKLSNTNLFWLVVILIVLFAIVIFMLIRYITKMNGKDEFIASESFKRHENIDYITSTVSINEDSLSPMDEGMEERNDICYGTLQSGKDRGKKIKTEIVSLSLNSIYDEIKLINKYDSLCGTVLATASLYVHHNQHDGSSWSL